MNQDKKLQAALKRKTVLRDTLGGTSGHKLKKCEVTYIENGWYHMNLDGYEFDIKWDSFYNETRVYFRNNKQLELAHYCDNQGVGISQVQYASSLHFGCGTPLIRALWVLGEVLSKRKSYDYR